MEMRMSMRVRMRRRARGRGSRRRLMVRRKIGANGLKITAPWTPSGRPGSAIRNFGPLEGPPGPCTQAFCCSGGPVHHPLDSIWAPRGCDQEFRASRGPPWAVHPIQKGPPGRPSARPEVAPEGLGAIFELLKKRWFLCYFEPSDRSSGVKGAKKRAKMEDQDAPRGQTPGIKAK